MDMLTAGIETSSITTEWAMSEILRNPAVQKKLHQELDAVTGIVGGSRHVEPSQVAEMAYLNAVVKETLRLHCPVPLLLPHEAMRDVPLAGGGFVPAGTRIIINAWAIARDASVWDNPLEFRPERWFVCTDGAVRNDFAFLPFGAGRRSCPGAALGAQTVTLTLTLAHLLHLFDWKLPVGVKDLDMSEAYGLTLPRRSKLWALPSARVPALLPSSIIES